MSLKKSAVSGVKWMSASSAIVQGVAFLKFAILARLLAPEDFGLMGMIGVVIGFAQAFDDMGISNAIIYRQDTTREQLSSIYWLGILAGILVFATVWAASPLVVIFYHEPRLRDLIFWTSFSFAITPLGQQFQVLLQKELQFSRLARLEVASGIIGAITAISLAMAGHGVFSLVWGQLASVSAMASLLIVFGYKTWHPSLHFRPDDLKNYIGFGLYQMGERSVNYFSSNVDYLVIGRFFGAEILGIYTMAYELVVRPLSKINPVLTRVAFPIFAKKQSDSQSLCRGILS